MQKNPARGGGLLLFGRRKDELPLHEEALLTLSFYVSADLYKQIRSTLKTKIQLTTRMKV